MTWFTVVRKLLRETLEGKRKSWKIWEGTPGIYRFLVWALAREVVTNNRRCEDVVVNNGLELWAFPE